MPALFARTIFFRLRRIGASGLEYALITGLIAVAATGAVAVLGQWVSGTFHQVDTEVSESLDRALSAPSDFAPFVDVPGVEPGDLVASDPRTVTGMARPAVIEISRVEGAVAAEYAVGGGEWTSTPGFISSGESVQVRMRTGPSLSQAYTVHLAIGGVERSFTAITRHPRTTPTNLVDFTPRLDLPVDQWRRSAEYQILEGLEANASISITGEFANYRLLPPGAAPAEENWTEWTRTPGEVAPGTGIQLQMKSASTPGTDAVATLTVGERTVTYLMRTSGP